MNIQINPRILRGSVEIPSSKSAAHRMLICAGLAQGKSVLSGISMSKDIEATLGGLHAMGAVISQDFSGVTVHGIIKTAEDCIVDCNESGSTLRFLIPVAAALGIETTFIGQGKLPQRPITPYIREFKRKGVRLDSKNTMPFTMKGKLSAGEYLLEGDISSQFISGLLFALPLCDGDSIIRLTSPLQSKPYADMTVDSLKRFGVEITETENHYQIKGNQTYRPYSTKVEGDYSQAAFFFTANALGCDIDILNLHPESVQGDKKILEILHDMGYTKNSNSVPNCFETNVEDIPDLVPILAVLGCFGRKTSRITNAARLRIKESDRLVSISEALNAVGGHVEIVGDSLEIHPVEQLTGGIVDSCNDHRIVMAMAIASVRSSKPIIIKNAEAVEKSYPDFFMDLKKLGGEAHVIHVEP